MTIHLPDELARDVEAEVSSGHFASIDEAMAEAARLLLRQRKQGQGGDKAIEALPPDLTDEERADQEVQRRLFDAGLLSEIKPPYRISTGTERFSPIPIQGEPLSETIIRERR